MESQKEWGQRNGMGYCPEDPLRSLVAALGVRQRSVCGNKAA